MSANGISTLATKELKQKSKLDLAADNRAADGNPRSTYDITTLPTQYAGDEVFDNPNAGGLVQGRPWIETISTFTFYEAINTSSALSTTQYVSGNKIYVYSASFDVVGFQNSRVVVNDIELLNVNTRGHNLVIMNSFGDLISTANYDTYGGGDAALTALAVALNGVAKGNIVALTVYDASSLNSTVRTAINNGYGSTNNNVWLPSRVDHIFIGVKQ